MLETSQENMDMLSVVKHQLFENFTHVAEE